MSSAVSPGEQGAAAGAAAAVVQGSRHRQQAGAGLAKARQGGRHTATTRQPVSFIGGAR